MQIERNIKNRPDVLGVRVLMTERLSMLGAW